MNKEEFLQSVKLDDSITQLNLRVMYDRIDMTGEIKFFVYNFPIYLGIYFVVDLDKNLLTYQIAQYEEKLHDIDTIQFGSGVEALDIIRQFITQFYLFIVTNFYY